MPALYIGTSGYTYKDWRGVFYPKGVAQKNWLAFYAQHYNAVEINATFYRPFPESVLTRWHDATPDSFRFVLKAPKVITHEKALEEVGQELEQFVASTAGLGEKLAAVLWQFPPKATKDVLMERLAAFLPTLPTSIKHVFEFRHASWFTDETYALLNCHNTGIVINDSPRLPRSDAIADSVMYVRFHGPGKLYDSSYSSAELQTWASKIAPHLDTLDIYLFFNNTMRGQALTNADELRELLKPHS
jgi:uncharacterized protein YecE (DUF72 family)